MSTFKITPTFQRLALVFMAAFSLTALSLIAPAQAADMDSLREQLRRQQKTLDALQAEINRHRAQLENHDKKLTHSATSKGGLSIAGEDGRFSAKLGGRLYMDVAIHDQDKSKLGDGTEFREARLALTGRMFKILTYKAEFGFADNAVSAKDVFIATALPGGVALKVGHFKEPFGLEEATSSRYTSFMERGFTSALAPGRHIGAAANISGDHWMAVGGVFGASFSSDPASEGDEGWDVAARMAFAPILSEGRLLHVGGAVRYNNPNNESVTYRSEPSSHLNDVNFVTTGALASVTHAVTAAAELGATFGPATLESEYARIHVSRENGSADLSFSAWYVEAGYFLTGETRPYSMRRGGFTRIKVNRNVSDGGFGAWQVAARYSMLDLSSKTVNGGIERTVTLGLNWYLNPYVRVMFNSVFVNNDGDATGNSANLLSGNAQAGDDDPTILQARFMIDF